jgi:hypothetical protein
VGLGRLYARAGDEAAAERAFVLAAEAVDADDDVRPQALARLAELLSRQRRHAEAAAAWQALLRGSPPRGDGHRSPLHRRAAEALAIHHEHRAHDLPSAERFAETLDGVGSTRQQQDVDRRLNRLRRKMERASGYRTPVLESLSDGEQQDS